MNTLEEALKAVAEHKARTEELNKAFRENGKTLLKPLFDKFFADEPRTDAVNWKQYTPYFNDGDACVFSVYEVEDANGVLSYYPPQEWTRDPENYSQPLAELVRQVSSLGDDAMLAMFGDHAKVTVTRAGEIMVEEYDHD